MKSNLVLPKSLSELKKLPRHQHIKLWARYVDSPYKRQLRALWYYLSCENKHLTIEPKHLTKILKYAENPEDCLLKVVKNKYNLLPGSEIVKTFRGIEFKITVAELNKFIYRGTSYKTLSAIAKEICGSKVSGPDFFGLNNKRVRKEIHG